MRYETIKTMILAVFVAASIFLTWMIWNFQPHYDTIDRRDIHQVSIAEERDTGSLIKPGKIMVNQVNRHYGTTDESEINDILKEMKGWSFYGSQGIKTLSVKDINSLEIGNNHVDIVFPENVPVKVYKDVVQFNDKSLPDTSFNRIVIDFTDGGHRDNNLYFLSTTSQKAYVCSVNYQYISSLMKDINKTLYDSYKLYDVYNLSKGKTILLPKDQTNMNTYRYITDEVPPEKFERALFPDPNFVKKGEVGDSQEYTNGTSMMRTNDSSKMLYYINPSEDSNYQTNADDLLKRSLEFMNHPGMWTDTYHYFQMNLKKHQVIFRMYLHGTPVFENSKMAEIMLQWGENEIYQYNRPFYRLAILVPQKVSESMLPGGAEVIQEISKISGISLDRVDDLQIGYQLINDTDYDSKQNNVLIFEPEWYYLYNGDWIPVSQDQLGGKQGGLE
ncbi:YycH family regulatory protein [Heyndrickxia acidicola]|uniref:Two-component system activity regulator YycH n=1 Tax=Heyndrickxia acidicola TaxID=209389 RepID=A0ABU6ME00_9BACI|nr:two-component system activity regulator YycH [Heyndrickxia acidicola]MED1202730.1 two-component system activity regulator YycH [Heyndrickxia acidicola]